ncbi:AAA family ATPase [Paenibacillus sp. y28]|uniref:AAA family ATPase n=1 Tax=Paenibacillus sp. y28 TaxID=3129110 RepID=UPI003015EFCC
MSKYGKEIIIGVVPVVLAFLMYIGMNVLPILLIGVIGFSLLYMVRSKGTIGFGAGGGKAKSKGAPKYMTFEEIGGQERAKSELKEALDFLIRHEEIQKFGIRPLKGILLTGPPGTGKTLLAKASAHYTDSVFVSASGSEFVEMYVGVGASRIRDLFKEARTKAAKENKDSAIIFIDEIDVIGGKREGGQHREYDQTLNQLLTEMDGIHSSDAPRILIMAATNRKEMLDSALLRPGRFDRHIGVDLPDKKGRLHILRIHAKNKPLAPGTSLERVASETFHFSGAQLESLMNEAAIYALRDEQEEVTQEHLSMAVDKVLMGEKTDRETNNEERRRVALHELGHAISAELVRPGSVSQVSLAPRGGALGYVRHQPLQERYLYTKDFIEDQIVIALGGAAAEEIFYNGRSTGSRGDFEQALQLVGNMIESGLTSLGIVERQMVTREEWTKASSGILDELFERTKTMLLPLRYVFEQAVDTLIQEEMMTGSQFRELLRQFKTPTSA